VSKGDKRGLWVSSNVETIEESVGAAVRYFPSVVEAVVEWKSVEQKVRTASWKPYRWLSKYVRPSWWRGCTDWAGSQVK